MFIILCLRFVCCVSCFGSCSIIVFLLSVCFVGCRCSFVVVVGSILFGFVGIVFVRVCCSRRLLVLI